MITVLLAADVKRQDASAAERGILVETLMENAGWAVARAARALLAGTYGKRVVVVCGKGNNAGDGLVAGRILAAQGAHVTAVVTSSSLSDLAAINLGRFPGRVIHLDRFERESSRADLLIDAIFGVGVTRAPEGPAVDAIRLINSASVPVLAVDLPSGVNADTGAIPGDVVRAQATVTFSGYKPGLLFAPGASYAGFVEVAEIGIVDGASAVNALEGSDVAALIPTRALDAHKRKSGTVLVVAGSRAMPGAAALVTGASVATGAGLTTLCAPEDVCRVVLARVPEITTIPVPETSEGTLDQKALDLIRPRLAEFTTMVIGPGLTTHAGTVDTVRALVEDAQAPIVIDADGLNAVAGATDLLRARTAPTILTPHAGELARLMSRSSGELDADRLAAAREAAHELGAIVVFKGPGTVTAGAGETWINTTGGPGLAQGGTGDVLSGVIGALIAQSIAARVSSGGEISVRLTDQTDGQSATELVSAGVWLHGRAADRIAARVAPRPANASALIAELGATIHEVAGA